MVNELQIPNPRLDRVEDTILSARKAGNRASITYVVLLREIFFRGGLIASLKSLILTLEFEPVFTLADGDILWRMSPLVAPKPRLAEFAGIKYGRSQIRTDDIIFKIERHALSSVNFE